MVRRSSGVNRECVVVAGCVERLFVSPRLFEMSNSSSRFMNRNAASRPPASSTETIDPPADICVRASAACGCDSAVG